MCCGEQIKIVGDKACSSMWASIVRAALLLRDAVSFSGKLLVYVAYELSRDSIVGWECWLVWGEIQRELGVICEISVEAMSFYRKRWPPFLCPTLYLYRALIITISLWQRSQVTKIIYRQTQATWGPISGSNWYQAVVPSGGQRVCKQSQDVRKLSINSNLFVCWKLIVVLQFYKNLNWFDNES